MNNILFLGYRKNKTKIINFLRNKKFNVVELGNKQITKSILKKNFILIISFGYKRIIKESIIKKLNRPIINLHMSFLPFNKGAHPNFWSFVENTPKGITIHEISNGIDDGDIIFQKKFKLDPYLEKFSTFKKTYNYLFDALEILFMENFEKIINHTYSTKKQGKFFTFHRKSDLPKDLINWDTVINKYINKQNQL